MTAQCSNCFFSFVAPLSADQIANNRGAALQGSRFCNRQAPSADAANPNGWLWPLVADDWWCGEGADSATKASYASGITGLPGLPLTSGAFMLTAASSTAVSNSAIDATSVVTLTPTNAAAAALVQAHGFYITVVDVAFTFFVGDSSSAAGTETFSYVVS